MDRNIDSAERLGRLGVGAVLLIVGVNVVAGVIATHVAVGVTAITVGAILTVTGLTWTSPIYNALGVDRSE